MKKLILITLTLLLLGCEKEQHPDWWHYTLHWYNGNMVYVELEDKIMTFIFDEGETASGYIWLDEKYHITHENNTVDLNHYQGEQDIYFKIYLRQANTVINTKRTIDVERKIVRP
jgi:hypothetical protein